MKTPEYFGLSPSNFIFVVKHSFCSHSFYSQSMFSSIWVKLQRRVEVISIIKKQIQHPTTPINYCLLARNPGIF